MVCRGHPGVQTQRTFRVKTVFADTSGLYAALDKRDPFHAEALELFRRAETQGWRLVTSSYVVHETWALVQSRLGWEALDELLDTLLPACEVVFVGRELHEAALARCRRERLRELSLTDCVSFELMKQLGLAEAIARDRHFERERILLPRK